VDINRLPGRERIRLAHERRLIETSGVNNRWRTASKHDLLTYIQAYSLKTWSQLRHSCRPMRSVVCLWYRRQQCLFLWTQTGMPIKLLYQVACYSYEFRFFRELEPRNQSENRRHVVAQENNRTVAYTFRTSGDKSYSCNCIYRIIVFVTSYGN